MVEPLQGPQRGSASGDCVFVPQAGEALDFPLYCGGVRCGKFQIGLYSCDTATGIDEGDGTDAAVHRFQRKSV